MSKLLQLVAIGALLAIGPIQAFAIDSDTLQIINALPATSGDPTSFTFAEATSGEGDLLVPTNPIFISSTLTGTPIEGDYVLALKDPDGRFSDIVRAQITSLNTTQFNFRISFLDNQPSTFPFPSGSIVNSGQGDKSEANFFSQATPQDVSSFLGFRSGGGDVQVMFSSNVDVIPEPEIYAMMGIGLVLMGFVARRRRQQGPA